VKRLKCRLHRGAAGCLKTHTPLLILMKTFITLLTALSLTAAPAVFADTEADNEELAQSIYKHMLDKGVKVRAKYSSGHLAEGQSYKITTTLHEGNFYQLMAATPYKSSDLDIRIYHKASGKLLYKDDDVDPIALAKLTPSSTAEYEIVLTMASCKGETAGWVLQTAFSPLEER